MLDCCIMLIKSIWSVFAGIMAIEPSRMNWLELALLWVLEITSWMLGRPLISSLSCETEISIFASLLLLISGDTKKPDAAATCSGRINAKVMFLAAPSAGFSTISSPPTGSPENSILIPGKLI